MKKSQKSILQNLALLSQVGIMMTVPIIGGVIAGNWLDKRLGTGSILLIVCVLLGVGASFRNLYVLSIRQSKDYKDSETPEQYVKRFEKSSKEHDKTHEKRK